MPSASRRESWNRHRKTPKGRYSHTRTRAKKRGLEFSISRIQHANILKKPCHYCGGELNQYGSGMDRINSSKGYVVGNVVPCCGSCNSAKSEFSSKAFKAHIIKIYKHWVSK